MVLYIVDLKPHVGMYTAVQSFVVDCNAGHC